MPYDFHHTTSRAYNPWLALTTGQLLSILTPKIVSEAMGGRGREASPFLGFRIQLTDVHKPSCHTESVLVFSSDNSQTTHQNPSTN
jgi:hypothetical protein